MPDAVGLIAGAVVDGNDRGAVLRIGKVTEVGADGRARLDTTGEVWLQSDVDLPTTVGQRVYAIMMGPTGVIAGRLTGEDSTVPIGAITAYAGGSTVIPAGWLLCDGQAVSRTTYATLFARLGTAYGAGNGSTTFNIPDLVERFAYGAGIASGDPNRGVKGGAATVTLTQDQMPAHTHGAAGGHTHTVPDYAEDQVADGTTAGVSDTTTSGTRTSSTSGEHTHETRGANLPHENMPPYLGVYYLIKAI